MYEAIQFTQYDTIRERQVFRSRKGRVQNTHIASLKSPGKLQVEEEGDLKYI